MRWFRMYSDLLQKKKIQRLPSQVFKDWVNVLCIANESKPRGSLPPLDDVAFKLHVKDDQAEAILSKLVAYGLLDETNTGYRAHDWDEHQPVSDDAAGRMSKKRKKDVPKVFGTSSEQPPNTFALEQSRVEQSRADDAGGNPALKAIERVYCKAVGRNFASNAEHLDLRDLLIQYEHPEPIIQGIELAIQRRQERGDKSKVSSPNYFKGAIDEVLIGPKQVAAGKQSALGHKPGKWKVGTPEVYT